MRKFLFLFARSEKGNLKTIRVISKNEEEHQSVETIGFVYWLFIPQQQSDRWFDRLQTLAQEATEIHQKNGPMPAFDGNLLQSVRELLDNARQGPADPAVG